MKAALLICILGWIACSPPPTTTSADRAKAEACLAKLEAATLEIASKNRIQERLQNEVDQLTADNAALKLRLEHLESASDRSESAELQSARDEARRYKEGLERAVAKLNEPRPNAVRTVPKTSQARSSVQVWAPRAVAIGNDVIVEGQLQNTGPEFAAGYLELTLLVDGEHAGTKTLTLEVAPGTVAEYNWTFTNAMTQGQRPQVTVQWGDHRR